MLFRSHDEHLPELLVLRSQEGEMSGEMLTFHEAISKLQEAEEDMVEFHKRVFESQMGPWAQMDKRLLTMTNQVEYDQEGEARLSSAKVKRRVDTLFYFSIYSATGGLAGSETLARE